MRVLAGHEREPDFTGCPQAGHKVVLGAALIIGSRISNERSGTEMTATTLPPSREHQPVGRPGPGGSPGAPVLDVVIPVYNEQEDLESCVGRLHAHLASTFPYPFRITIADNASTDATLLKAQVLARRLPEVEVVHLELKGRGRALHTVWSASDAPVLAYMDVDLSTDLAGLLPLVAPLLSGHSDLAIGTRLAPNSRVIRGAKREIISRSYNLLLRGTLATRSPMPSAASRPSAATSPSGFSRWSRTPAGSSTPSCWSWPSGPGSASTRSPSTGSTTPTAGSTSSPPRWRT
jgi:hypothetical protein